MPYSLPMIREWIEGVHMLERSFTIPILLGLFLGIIMVGVQISTTALNAAVSSGKDIGLVVFEKVDQRSMEIEVMGKKYRIVVPFSVNSRELIGAVQTKVNFLQDRAKLKTGEWFQSLSGPARKITGEIRAQWEKFFH